MDICGYGRQKFCYQHDMPYQCFSILIILFTLFTVFSDALKPIRDSRKLCCRAHSGVFFINCRDYNNKVVQYYSDHSREPFMSSCVHCIGNDNWFTYFVQMLFEY